MLNESGLPTHQLFGVTVEAITKSQLMNVVAAAIRAKALNCIVGNHNLHSLYLFHRNAEMRRFYQCNSHTHIDGMSLIFSGKLAGFPLHRHHRTGYLDWFDDFLRLAEEHSWRVYFLGARQKVAEGIPEHFRATYPRLSIRTHHGYDAFSPETTVFKEIEDFAPHVLLVGLGMPLQEQWILSFRDRLNVNVILPCGAIMDYYMGAQKPAPRWMGQIGIEWLFRLVHRPRALFVRYLVEPVLLTAILLRNRVRGVQHAAE
jgi:N-acetylglucosaminyldiphosphoundecaprenol N-acetyl-beta-D-mannosaminyltransferase